MMTRTQTMDDPLYRMFAAICPGGRSTEYDEWVQAMTRLHQTVFPGQQVTDQALVNWLEASKLNGHGYVTAAG